MHELGVVLHIIDTVEDIAKKNKASHISAVTLEIGEVSTIIPELFTDCWKWAIKKNSYLKDSKLNLKGRKAITHCENCGKDFPTTVFEKICPYCNSEKTYLLTGNEFNIVDIAIFD